MVSGLFLDSEVSSTADDHSPRDERIWVRSLRTCLENINNNDDESIPQGQTLVHRDYSFFDQFSDFLEHSDSLPGKTLLMGDFNFHFENVENNNSRKLHDIIDMFNLTQS